MKHFLLISALLLSLNSVATAQINCALVFDGTDDFVACPAINPPTFTLEAWVNPDGVINDQSIISTLNPYMATGVELHIKSGQVIATIWNGSSLKFEDIISTKTITAGNWVHVACTYTTGGLFVLYVNGMQEASATIPLYTQGIQQLFLGRRAGQAAYFFDGIMDEVVVWNTVRTAEQIMSDMRGSISTSSPGLLAYYMFIDGNGTTLIDATGANNGTLYNSPSYLETSTPKVTLSSSTVTMEAYADKTAITVASNISWTASVSTDAPWITLNNYSGIGNTVIAISATQNTTSEARTGTVTLTDACNLTTTFTVTQNKPAIGINLPGEVALPAASNTYDISFTSNTSWYASVSGDAPWLTLDAASGKGDYLLHITSAVNSTEKKRKGTVTITDGGNISFSLFFKQDSSYIELSPVTITEPLEGNNDNTVGIYTNTPWTASVNPEATWLSLDQTSGTGASYIILYSSFNNTAAERSATITVTNGGAITRQVSVTQAGPVTDTLQANNALAFDGKDDYVICPKVNPEKFTVEAWVKPAVVNTDQAVVSTLSGPGNTGYELHIGPDGTPVMTIRNGTSWLGVAGKSPLTVSKWTHLAASFDGSICKLYVNGTLTATAAATSYAPGTSNMTIGRRSSGAYFFKGTIDEVRVWNTVRSQPEIIGSYRSSFTRPSVISNLISSFKSNQGTAGGDNRNINALEDYSASHNTGALKGFDLTAGNTTSNFEAGYDASDAGNVLTASTNKLYVNDKAGSTVTFEIISNASWSVSGAPAWMTLSSTSGTGNITVTITAVSDNTGAEMRTAVLTLEAPGNDNINITVSQIPKITPEAPATGDGSAANPYRIANLANLYWLSLVTDIDILGCNFIQTADIDASASAAFDDNKGFTPIGSAYSFTGSYNGKGHTIKGLTIIRSDGSNVGLFRTTTMADIDSIGIVNCSVSGYNNIGGLIGMATSGSVNNCYSSGTVSGNSFIGGLVGLNIGGSIVNSHFSGNVNGNITAIGGLAGENRNGCHMDNCYATGLVSGAGSTGGLVGFNQTHDTLTNCFTDVEVYGTTSVGGLVGYNIGNCYIENCHSRGIVKGIIPVGGLAGQNDSYCTIKNCYSFSAVTGSSNSVGGLVGRNTTYCSVTDSYAGGNVIGHEFVGGLIGENVISSQITNCYGTGNVTGDSEVAGLIGSNLGTAYAEGCYSTGRISGSDDAGGLFGLNSDATISNSYSTADVTCKSRAGGFVGYIYKGTIKNCYSAGTVTADEYAGVFCGSFTNSEASSCYWKREASEKLPAFGIFGASTAAGNDSLTTAEMKQQSSFSTLGSFITTWKISEGHTYPALRSVKNNAPFAFRDTVNMTARASLSVLLVNDYDVERFQDSLTLRVTRLYGTGTTDSVTWYRFKDGTTTGSTDSIEYRIGELLASGDTLWGNRAIAVFRKIANTAPVITSVAPASAVTGIEYTYAVVATDAESNNLTYSLSGQPAGMTIDDGGTIRWTPPTGTLTSGSVTLTVSDGELSDTETFTITVSPATGINTTDGEVIKLYPNPAADILYLTGTSGMASVYDITGRLIFAKKVEEGGWIDVRMLRKGTYFVRINGKSYKFIKL